MNAYFEIGKSALALTSEFNKVSKELYENPAMGGFFGYLSNKVHALAKTLDYSIETKMHDLMKQHGFNAAMFDDFKRLVADGYVEFNMDIVPSLERDYGMLKDSQWFQFLRVHGKDTKQRKEDLKLSGKIDPKTQLVIYVIDEKATDFSLILMRHFLLGDLFRPTAAFIRFYDDIFEEIAAKPEINVFFMAATRGAKKVGELLEKYNEVVALNASNRILLKKEEATEQFEGARKKVKRERDLTNKENAGTRENSVPNTGNDNNNGGAAGSNTPANILGNSIRTITQQEVNAAQATPADGSSLIMAPK